MTERDNVVDLAAHREPPNPGNGAREAMIDLCANRYVAACYAPTEADAILADLWMRGFKVVPLGPTDGEKEQKS